MKRKDPKHANLKKRFMKFKTAEEKAHQIFEKKMSKSMKVKPKKKGKKLGYLEECTNLDEFESIRLIGQGHSATVRLVKHIATGHRIAIKAYD